MKDPQPTQPIIQDDDGVLRFRANAIEGAQDEGEDEGAQDEGEDDEEDDEEDEGATEEGESETEEGEGAEAATIAMSKREQHHCPACSAKLVSDPIGTPLRCTSCTWHLISLSAWLGRPPFDQGWLLYMQSSWPTSELRGKKNPYPRDTPAWTEFCRGEQRATQSAQDGEE